MKLFKEYDEIVKKVNFLDIEGLKKEYNLLDDSLKIDILIKWFGMCPLFKEMVENKKGLENLKDSLINIKYEALK